MSAPKVGTIITLAPNKCIKRGIGPKHALDYNGACYIQKHGSKYRFVGIRPSTPERGGADIGLKSVLTSHTRWEPANSNHFVWE